VITISWAVAFVVMLILAASGVLPADQRWWAWTCGTGVVMGLFGLWYVPILQRERTRAAAARLAEAQSSRSPAAGGTGVGGTAAGGAAAQDSPSASDSLDNGSNTVSSTDTPGRSTRS
jgi:hypothetical protein